MAGSRCFAGGIPECALTMAPQHSTGHMQHTPGVLLSRCTWHRLVCVTCASSLRLASALSKAFSFWKDCSSDASSQRNDASSSSSSLLCACLIDILLPRAAAAAPRAAVRAAAPPPLLGMMWSDLARMRRGCRMLREAPTPSAETVAARVRIGEAASVQFGRRAISSVGAASLRAESLWFPAAGSICVDANASIPAARSSHRCDGRAWKHNQEPPGERR